MTLPEITIPKVIIESIPMEQIPSLLHPPLVHFAVVLPIMIVILEIVNILLKRNETPEMPKGKGVSTLSMILSVVAVLIFFGAYVSGSVDGKAAWDLLGEAGQEELKGHKILGTYLFYGSLFLFILKLIALFTGKRGRIVFLGFATLFALLTLIQGKEGGELVYKHGANVAKVKELDDKLFDLQDELETLKSATTPKAAEQLPTEQPQAAQTEAPTAPDANSTDAVSQAPATAPSSSVTETDQVKNTKDTQPDPAPSELNTSSVQAPSDPVGMAQ